jgi:putative intracellular protease/amidase
MAFSRALLAGQVEPLQLVALLRALAPGYALIEQEGPALAAALGAQAFPWGELARSPVLERDAAQFAAIAASPPSAAAALWLEQLRSLARQAPHRFLAHVYVRYGGDLSGGQQLAEQANAILASRGLPPVGFWAFERPVRELKDGLHAAFEQLDLSESEEDELVEEAEIAFRDIQPEDYVGIFFSGGRAPEYIREDTDLLRITRWFWDNQRPMASVCHGVEIPARAGIVNGLRMATVAKCRFDLEVCGGIYVNEPCVIDRHMVSGRTYHDSGHFVGPWIRMLDAQSAGAPAT